jgi:phage terminase small subunit
LASNDLTADRILEEMRRLALVDQRGFFDDHGNLKPIQDLTAEQGACLASVEVIQRNITAGDGQVDTLHKIKTWDKVRALEMLGKHFALLTEKINVSGGLELSWKGSAADADGTD